MLNWVELDAAAIRRNIEQFRQRLGDSQLGAVVKSNAYGHGMLEVAAIARRAGVGWLCVNSLDEARNLRNAGHEAKVLVMGHIRLSELEAVAELDLRPVLCNPESVERLAEVGRRFRRQLPVHVKVETGTHRQGVLPGDLLGFARRVRELDGLVLEGVTTHFANIEDTTDHRFAERQMEAFDKAVIQIEADRDRPLRHAACSAAALLFGRTHLDMARIGISLYGLWPSRETYVSCRDRGNPALDLVPALTWKTRVAQLKSVPEGEYVGYGCTYRTTRATRIAVLPVGYHEGYDRRLSNVGYVLIGGRRAPIRGRVCMNMCMADVTDVPGVQLEDEVVLLGGQDAEQLPAERLAEWCGTISYEIVSRIHPGLSRVVVDSG